MGPVIKACENTCYLYVHHQPNNALAYDPRRDQVFFKNMFPSLMSYETFAPSSLCNSNAVENKINNDNSSLIEQ